MLKHVTAMRLMAAVAMLLIAVAGPARGAVGGSHITVSAQLATAKLQRGQQAVLAVVGQVGPGLHAQSHTPLGEGLIAYQVTLDPATGVDVLAPQYPPGQIENYPALGQLSVYTGKVIIYVPLRVAANAPLGAVTIKGTVSCQICNDKACFAPEDVAFELQTEVVDASAKVAATDQTLFKGFDPTAFATATTQPQAQTASATPAAPPVWTVAGVKIGDSPVLVLLLALFVGVIFNLMPCVLPVLPLKAIGFYEAAQHGRGRSIFLGVCFSIGIVATFAVLALLVVVLRTIKWGEQFSNPIFIWTIVAILLIMGAGMFGAFAVTLPTAVYSFTPRHDTVGGNVAFGALGAVLSTPCTAPLFPPLLAWAVAKPQWLGVTAVLTVGVGMAIPYLLLSAFPELAKRVPRTGPWSLLLKEMLGFLLLASAAYFAGGQLLGVRGAVIGTTVVVVAASLFLIGRTISFTRRVMPIAMAVLFAIVLAGAAVAAAARLTITPAGGDVIAWQPYSEEAFAKARASGQITMVEFTAAWCTNCLALEATTFHDPRAGQAVRDAHAIALRADLTDRHAPGWGLLGQLNPAGGIPLTAIYGAGSDAPTQLASLYTTQELVDALAGVKTK